MPDNEEINNSRSRHWLYGFNVAILAVIAVVMLSFVLYLTTKFNKRMDCTTGGMYSLSESTRKLVAEIDKKDQKYELINLMNSSPEQITQVGDLLTEYSRVSKNVSASDTAVRSREDLENKIKERYAAELKPYEETVSDFDKLAADIEKFSQAESANFAALAQKPNASKDEKSQAAQFQGLFGNVLPDLTGKTKRGIRRITESTLPEWNKAATGLKAFFEQEEVSVISVLGDSEKTKGRLEPALQAYVESAKPRYEEILAKMKAFQTRLNKLPELKSQAIVEALGPDTVLILGPTSAKVIDRSTLYKAMGPPDPTGKEPTTSFEGEQAISSALLGMVRPDKVKVVFITVAPQNLLSGQLSAVADRLKDANFDVLEWSPPGAPQMNPQTPPPSLEPPAIGKGVVWIVLPPEPANPQMMMMGMPPPNPQPVVDALKRHMGAGGQVMVLAEAASTNPFGGADTGKFVYDDVTRPFGIDVKSNFTVVKSYPTADGTMVVPELQISRYTDSPITKPLQSLLTDFTAGRSRTGYIGAPTVVAVLDKNSPDVTATVIIDTGKDPDAWGESNMAPEPKFDPAEDIKGPVPMAASASRKITLDGKPFEQRMVVIGNKVFAFNDVLEAARPEIRSGQLYVVPRYPGNGELFLNSVLWLSGYENMIAVGSKTNAALRIRDISPATLDGIRWGILWFGVPFGALLLGVVVWFFRRS